MGWEGGWWQGRFGRPGERSRVPVGSKACYQGPQVLLQVRGCWGCEGPSGAEESGAGEGVSEERESDGGRRELMG